MRRVLWSCIVILLCPLLSAVAAADGAAPNEVQRAAEAGLTQYIAALPQEQLADFGFVSMEEAERAVLGRPYRVYALPPASSSLYSSQQSLLSALQATDMWLYPLLVGQEPRSTLLVDRMPDGYRAVQLGNRVLPSLLAAWEARLPAQARQQNLASYETRLVRMPQVHSDFLLVISAGEEYVAPLRLSLELGHLPTGQLLPAGDVVPALLGLLHRDDTLSSESQGPAGGSASQLSHRTTGGLTLPLGLTVLVLAMSLGMLLVRSRGAQRRVP